MNRKKKVLMVFPKHGGIEVYANGILNHICTEHFELDTFSSDINLYNKEDRTWITADSLEETLKKEILNVNWDKYDLIVYHYGKNDAEQYIPVLLKRLGITVKKELYLVHYLSWNLFEDFIIDDEKYKEVNEAVKGMPHLMFYGKFPQEFWFENYSMPESYIINYYPEAHSHEEISETEREDFEKLIELDKSDLPLVIWPGFPSNFKNYQLLLEALPHLKKPIKLVFMGQGWGKRLKDYPKNINGSEIKVVERYLNTKEFLLAIQYSLFGVLLYQQPDSGKEFFQGSGTLPNFIYQGKSTIVLNEGCLPEYVSDSGITLEEKDPVKLARAIEKLLSEDVLKVKERAAHAKKPMFSMDMHTSTLEGYIRYLIK